MAVSKASKDKRLKMLAILVGILSILFVSFVSLSLYLMFMIQSNVSNLDFEQKVMFAQLSNDARQQRVIADPKEQRVYIPELKVSLPYNEVTKYLAYDYYDSDLRLTSVLIPDGQLTTMSCDDMVRVKAEATPNAYSPNQKHYATVELGDGTKLQVYASSFEECASDAWASVSPKDIAEQFKAAQAY